MAEATEILFNKVLAAIKGDSTGLNSSSAASFLRQVVRSGDSQELSLNDYPADTIDVSSDNRGPVGPTTEAFECIVTHVLYANRDPGNLGIASPDETPIRASLDSVMARIMTVFDNAQLTSIADPDDGSRSWYFSPMFRVFLGNLQSTSARVRQPISYKVWAYKGLT